MPIFVSIPASIAELAHGEKLCTQSINHLINHSPSLFDAPETETLASEQCVTCPSLSDTYKTAENNFITPRAADTIRSSHYIAALAVMQLFFAVFYVPLNDGPYTLL